MPTPIYIDGASTWKQQRGTRFGTTEDGRDWIEIVWRGPSGGAANWRTPYVKGSTCPEDGFDHCTLIRSPTVTHDGSAGFSIATLRYEGVSPLGGTAEGSDAQIRFTAEWAHLEITAFGDDPPDVYVYEKQIVTARYIKDSKPASFRYSGQLDNVDTPEPRYKESGTNGPTAAVLKTSYGPGGPEDDLYTVDEISLFLEVVKAGDSYEVTEYHAKVLQPVASS